MEECDKSVVKGLSDKDCYRAIYGDLIYCVDHYTEPGGCEN